MKSQGLQANQQVTFLSDGADDEGAAAVSESGVRALARLVSRRDAAEGNGANGQRVGKRAEHDIGAGATYRSG
jgi:hypothetical protein